MNESKRRKEDQSLLSRRDALKLLGGAAAAAGLDSIGTIGKALAAKHAPRVMVLGIDGMDPNLLTGFISQGKMPNARRLIEMGGFAPLVTSIPPQSPVAWSNFITGMDPGGHGIFDFIHREPESLIPFLSTSKTTPPKKTVSLGDWIIPLASGEVQLLRKGKAFWNTLEDHGVDCMVSRIPSNFPPEESEARTISGMGTPDVLGTYGTFSYFTDDPPEHSEAIGGGKVFPVIVRGGKVAGELIGPRNAFRKGQPKSTVPFTVWFDATHPVATIEMQGQKLILQQGEWSDWLVVNFDMIPHLEKVSGICRMYLKEVRPHFRLYVSPININPADPALPLSTPPDYVQKVARDMGYFYTQGMPEDTKALSNGVLTDGEYLEQAEFVLRERLRLYDYELSRFNSGFFFFYFTSLDLNSHMFWRTVDRGHPLYDPALEKEHGWFIPYLYQQMDAVIGQAMKLMDDRTILMVMSDHGFTSFRRGFNLNTWLLNNGYAALIDPLSREESEFFENVDWPETRAYGLGINSLYLNLQGREGTGIVSSGPEAESLARELAVRLTQVRDPLSGEQVITHAYRPARVYRGEHAGEAPDLILGYNRHYRSSWETILGKYPQEELVDNDDKWSGDHCMDAIFLPGVLLCSRKFASVTPALYDLAPSILSIFGIDKPGNMVGRSIFE